MNVVTISDVSWVPNHLTRFIKLGRRAMPDAKFHLLLVSDMRIKHATLDRFDTVRYVKEDHSKPGYLYFNELRFSLLKRFKISELLFIDPDVDIFTDLSDVALLSAAPLLWVRSPIEPNGFSGLMRLLGLAEGPPWGNCGMLYMRQSFNREYKRAADKVVSTDFNPRMCGNAAFNAMLRMLPDGTHFEIPYIYDVIWWDTQTMLKNKDGMVVSAYQLAKAIHYCNENGKKRRAQVDGRWIW
jgi:hypothetical protein